VTAPRARDLDRAITLVVLAGGLPAVLLACTLLWTGGFTAEIRWTLAGLLIVFWLAAASAARGLVAGSLHLIANLLGALREGDYSIRGLTTRSGSSVATVMREVNELGATLQRQRAEALESTTLLGHVLEDVEVAIYAFDPADTVLLVNKAGAHLVGRTRESLVGVPAAELGFAEFLSGEPRRLIDRAFTGRQGRYEVRRAQFYREGRPHRLLVISDLSQALREEEQAAWQRIVRVLSHEINNSLTPIKSMAHSLRRIVDRAGAFSGAAEVQHGLSLIEDRSGALSRFMRAYAQLAKLPKPNPRRVHLAPVVRRIVELEGRLPIVVRPSPEITVLADSDQLEQLLINIVRNGVDASLETGGLVAIEWKAAGGWLELTVDDEGKGLAETSNLFVPFFTTKPAGSGIGLALSRQIAEAHQGTITLANRTPGPGCRATLRLPLAG
jgi:PAS domain S-box-containing protein